MGVVAGAAFLGLMLGVAALVVSLALLGGFQSHIRARLISETPHLVVTPAGRPPFQGAEGLAQRLMKVPGVETVSPVARGRVWISLRDQPIPAELVGRVRVAGLILDISQAHQLGSFIGDVVMLVSSRTRLSPIGPVPIVASFPVTELTPTSTARRTPEAILPIEDARRLFALGEDGATGYELRLANPELAAATAREIQKQLGDKVSTTTWEEANRSLVLALKLERIVLFATVFLIVVVAGLNLAATSAVLAATRASDAAVLSVLGASPRSISRVFLATGAVVGLTGTAAGLIFGGTLAVILDKTRAIPLPAQLYSLDHVPFSVQPLDLLAVAMLSIVWSLVASSLPARAAARLDVSEVLRAV